MASQATSSGTARNPGEGVEMTPMSSDSQRTGPGNNSGESQDRRSSAPARPDTDNRTPTESSEPSESNKQHVPWKTFGVSWQNIGRVVSSWWSARNIMIALASLVLTVLSVWVAVNANNLAVWTANKDYLEYCSNQGPLKTADCRKAGNTILPPPPGRKQRIKSIVKRASSVLGYITFDDFDMVNKIYLTIAILLQVGIAMTFIILLSRYRRNLPKNKIS